MKRDPLGKREQVYSAISLGYNTALLVHLHTKLDYGAIYRHIRILRAQGRVRIAGKNDYNAQVFEAVNPAKG